VIAAMRKNTSKAFSAGVKVAFGTPGRRRDVSGIERQRPVMLRALLRVRET